MNWICPEDRAPLVEPASGASLDCSKCGRAYPVVDGVPVFAFGERERDGTEHASPALEALGEAVRESGADEAAARTCRKLGCSRSPYSADWKFFFSVPANGVTVELGAGFGDDSLDLAGKSGVTLSVVPSLANARIVREHLRERAGRAWPVAVLTDASRLPLADGSVHAIALEDAAAAGFGLDGDHLAAAAAEWKRVLAPGGVVFLGLANGLHRLPGLAALRGALRARPHPESLNRQVKRWAAPGRRGRIGPRRAIRTLTRLGFGSPVVYAPLPDENDSRVVIPVHDAQVVRYFLDNLIRRNSRVVRLALRGAHLCVTLGWFGRLVPYYYLIFRTGPAS